MPKILSRGGKGKYTEGLLQRKCNVQLERSLTESPNPWDAATRGWAWMQCNAARQPKQGQIWAHLAPARAVVWECPVCLGGTRSLQSRRDCQGSTPSIWKCLLRQEQNNAPSIDTYNTGGGGMCKCRWPTVAGLGTSDTIGIDAVVPCNGWGKVVSLVTIENFKKEYNNIMELMKKHV